MSEQLNLIREQLPLDNFAAAPCTLPPDREAWKCLRFLFISCNPKEALLFF